MTTPTRLPIARYRFRCELAEDLRLPEYAGSLLRGVFGAALRRTACMTRLPQCGQCPLLQTCPYPAIFETPPRKTRFAQAFSALPNPYVIEPPPLGLRHAGPGQPLVFSMVLVGEDTLRQLPLIIHAWQRALAHGLGRQRVTGRLVGVNWVQPLGAPDEPIMDEVSGRVLPHEPGLWFDPAPVPASEVALQILTPMRLQHQGRALPIEALTPRALVTTLLRRAGLLLEAHAGIDDQSGAHVRALVSAASSLRDDRTGLRWTDWTRFSSRQQQEMTLGGVTGPWLLSGDLAELVPWLRLGEWLHVGKNATMGMGGYRLEVQR